MEATIKSLNAIKLITPEEALTVFFERINCPEIKPALKKWLAFGMAENTLGDLNTEQLADFLEKIPDLLLIIYTSKLELRNGQPKIEPFIVAEKAYPQSED